MFLQNLHRIVVLACLASVALASGKIVELTDETFDSETAKGVWMIKVYAPWCKHCQQLEPLWEAFAEEAAADGVRVGKINGDQQRSMMVRLGVKHFPSIYLLREGRTYEYKSGARNVMSFRAFATSAYQSVKPYPFYRAPNSSIGRFLGLLYSVPSKVAKVYRWLRDEHELSDTAIVVGFLSLPVAIGGIIICALDAMYLRRAREEFGPEHEHQE